MRKATYTHAMEKSPVVLTLKLENSQPIPLGAFVGAFTSIADEYRKTAREHEDFESADAEIFIREVRSGSIIAEMLPSVLPVLPLVAAEADKIWLAVEFVKKWETRLTKLASGIIPDGATRSDLKTWANSAESIARDPNASSTLEAATFEDGKRQVRASFTFRTPEARQIQQVIETEYERLDEKTHADYERVLMVFTRSDVGDAPVGKRSGERVLIQEVSEKPLAITYGSELAEQRIKHEIREGDENVYKKGFNVDVKVQRVGTRPVAYSIMQVHGIIDLPDD